MQWSGGCSLTDKKGCISSVLARDRNQVEYVASATSYKIEEIAQLLTEERGEGCSLSDRRACISGGPRERHEDVTSEVVQPVSAIS